MKNRTLTILIIIFVIIILSLFRTKYSEYNLKKVIGACMLAQQMQTTESFNKEKSRKYCEEEIKNKLANSE